jgi:hypothetical protein
MNISEQDVSLTKQIGTGQFSNVYLGMIPSEHSLESLLIFRFVMGKRSGSEESAQEDLLAE